MGISVRGVYDAGWRADGCRRAEHERYDPFPVLRFLLLGIPLVVLVMAGSFFVLDHLEQLPHTAEADFRMGVGQLPGKTVVSLWLLEALALATLFLLLQGRMATWWGDGLLTGWIAWVFRGPLLVLTAVGAGRLDPLPWWAMAQRWLLLYSLCGLALAMLARGLKVER